MNVYNQNDIGFLLEQCVTHATSRIELWASLARKISVRSMAEIGVYRGEFAAAMLSSCPDIDQYFMIDPWKHLGKWNKPANVGDDLFEKYYQETLDATHSASNKRVVLRGTTTEVIDQIPNGQLDMVYIDGDHTLRGITIDLVRSYSKIREHGLIAGDDFIPSVWQHSKSYEPTLVFPFSVYFAEAVGARIFALPFNQFLIQKSQSGFAFADLTGKYSDTQLRKQILSKPKKSITAPFRRILNIFRSTR